MSNPLQTSIVSLILSLGIAAKVVLAILAACSVVSWGVIFYKVVILRKAEKENQRFLNHFQTFPTLYDIRKAIVSPNAGPMWSLSKNMIEQIDPDVDWEQGGLRSAEGGLPLSGIERTLKSGISEAMDYYEETVPILATIGNTAPFIGLLGTVWGIMSTFRSISLTESANIAVVAPGIAEALTATAFGLAAAIPAVVAYNFFVHRLRKLENQLDIFMSELMTLLETVSRSGVCNPSLAKQEILQK